MGLFGGAYIFGGVLTADPVAGFPPGTTPEMVHRTCAEGRRGWAWFYGVAIPVVFAALMAVGLAVGINPAARPFSRRPGSG